MRYVIFFLGFYFIYLFIYLFIGGEEAGSVSL